MFNLDQSIYDYLEKGDDSICESTPLLQMCKGLDGKKLETTDLILVKE